mmetsp:Transcript_965/g.2233  ORF Transcript_965/g.2233 Transcript_965/m.2233 type:complete len:245 (-) Transcript_965:2427-3161(-)
MQHSSNTQQYNTESRTNKAAAAIAHASSDNNYGNKGLSYLHGCRCFLQQRQGCQHGGRCPVECHECRRGFDCERRQGRAGHGCPRSGTKERNDPKTANGKILSGYATTFVTSQHWNFPLRNSKGSKARCRFGAQFGHTSDGGRFQAQRKQRKQRYRNGNCQNTTPDIRRIQWPSGLFCARGQFRMGCWGTTGRHSQEHLGNVGKANVAQEHTGRRQVGNLLSKRGSRIDGIRISAPRRNGRQSI